MVRVVVGDLFQSDAQTLTNTINCAGVMGKGVALEFKKRFPDMFADYERRCTDGMVRLGEPYIYHTLFPPWILNFPTKDHWRSPSHLSDIVAGLEYLNLHYHDWGIESLAVPPLGCGFGGLEWRIVGPTLFRHLAKLEIPVDLYAPPETPEGELAEAFLSADTVTDIISFDGGMRKIEPSWIALVEIMFRRSSASRGQKVTRTMLQSIAYFAEVAGIQLDLPFTLGKYGVRSPNLRAVVSKLENNGLCEETQLGPAVIVTPGATYADARRSFRTDLDKWEAAIERVATLLSNINAQTAATLATVHFAARTSQGTGGELDVDSVINHVKQVTVGERTPLASDRDLVGVLRYLESAGWLSEGLDRSNIQ